MEQPRLDRDHAAVSAADRQATQALASPTGLMDSPLPSITMAAVTALKKDLRKRIKKVLADVSETAIAAQSRCKHPHGQTDGQTDVHAWGI